jgi:hypothetical protein
MAPLFGEKRYEEKSEELAMGCGDCGDLGCRGVRDDARRA